MVAWKQYLKSFASFFELSLAPSMNQNFKEENNIIHAGYRKEFIPMVPQGGVMIKLTFNELNFLETIDAKLSYQQ